MKKILTYITASLLFLSFIGCEDDQTGLTDLKNPVAVITNAWNADDANVMLSGYVISPGSNVTLVFEYGTSAQLLDQKVYADFVVKNDTAFLSATLGGLTKLTTYYIRVNAIKANNDFVSETISFATTEFKTPQIKEVNKKNVASDSLGIVVKINPSGNPTRAWLNYGTSIDALTQTSPASNEVKGAADVNVELHISNLSKSTMYFYQVVTENMGGKRYSEIFRIRTNEGTVSDFDGKVYQTIKIGDQVWTASNWACDKYADGTVVDSCFIYKGQSNKLNAYGRLYTYDALKQKKLAPQGWRVPTKDDWDKLIVHLGGELNAGIYLKDKSFLSIGARTETPDLYNFSSLPTGMRNTNGEYFHEKDASVNWYAYYWGLTDMGSGDGFRVYMTYIYEGCYTGKAPSGNAYSVRLIKE